MHVRGAGQQCFIAAAHSCLASVPSWHQTAATRPPSSWPGTHLVCTRSRECDIFLFKKKSINHLQTVTSSYETALTPCLLCREGGVFTTHQAAASGGHAGLDFWMAIRD